MEKLLKKTLALGFGISTLTQEQVNKFVKELMKSQGISEREAKKLARDLIDKSKETQHKVNALVTDAAGTLFRSVGLATKKDIDSLRKELNKKKKTKKAGKSKK